MSSASGRLRELDGARKPTLIALADHPELIAFNAEDTRRVARYWNALPLIADVVEAAEEIAPSANGHMGKKRALVIALTALREHLEGGDVNTVGGGQIGC